MDDERCLLLRSVVKNQVWEIETQVLSWLFVTACMKQRNDGTERQGYRKLLAVQVKSQYWQILHWRETKYEKIKVRQTGALWKHRSERWRDEINVWRHIHEPTLPQRLINIKCFRHNPSCLGEKKNVHLLNASRSFVRKVRSVSLISHCGPASWLGGETCTEARHWLNYSALT